MADLICIAHRPEARAFLRDPSWIREESFVVAECYQKRGVKTRLLITGEGLFAAGQATAAALGMFRSDVTRVVNLGVAGILDADYVPPLGSALWIRTCYGQSQGKRFQFQSYSSSDARASHDCLSALERILDESTRDTIAAAAPLVDRELWAIAAVAQAFGLPWVSCKVLSDLADDSAACELVRGQADQFSQRLYEEYLNLNRQAATSGDVSSNSEKTGIPVGYYFTRSMQNRYEKLLGQLSARWQVAAEDAQMRLLEDAKDAMPEGASPKQKAAKLVQIATAALNPVSDLVKEQLQATLGRANSQGYQVDLENGFIQLQRQLRNESDRDLLVEELGKMDFSHFQNLLEGRIDGV